MSMIFTLSRTKGKLGCVRVEHPKLGKAWFGIDDILENNKDAKFLDACVVDKSVILASSVEINEEYDEFDFLKENGWTITPVYPNN